MSYYNYHAKAKQLINSGHLTEMKIVRAWGINCGIGESLCK